jgi:hypothetical protein
MNLKSWGMMHNISAQAMAELEWYLKAPTATLENEGVGSEAGVAQRCRLKAPHNSGILWRNNVGELPDRCGTPVRFGLANDSKKVNKVTKSSDLIGLTSVEWHGRTFGVFTAIETKAPKWIFGKNKSSAEREQAQLNYINIVRSFGGIAGFATSAEDYTKNITEYCNVI